MTLKLLCNQGFPKLPDIWVCLKTSSRTPNWVASWWFQNFRRVFCGVFSACLFSRFLFPSLFFLRQVNFFPLVSWCPSSPLAGFASSRAGPAEAPAGCGRSGRGRLGSLSPSSQLSDPRQKKNRKQFFFGKAVLDGAARQKKEWEKGSH